MNRRIKLRTPLSLIFAGILAGAGGTALALPPVSGPDAVAAADASQPAVSPKSSSAQSASTITGGATESNFGDDGYFAQPFPTAKPAFHPLLAAGLFRFRIDILTLPTLLSSRPKTLPEDPVSNTDRGSDTGQSSPAQPSNSGTDQGSSSSSGNGTPRHVAESANQPNSQFPLWALYSTRNVDPRIKPNAGIRLGLISPNYSPVVPDYDRTIVDTRNWSVKVALAEFAVNPDPKSAKFEEFRDVKDGVVTGVEAHYRDRDYFLNAVGRQLGRSDEDLNIEGGKSGKYTFSFYEDQTPHNYDFGAQSLYSGIGTGNLTISDSIRTDIQNSTSIDDADTKLAGYVGQEAQSVNLRLEREKVGGDVTILATYPWLIQVGASDESRDGERPWSASFGFADFVEIPWAVHYDTHDIHINAEYTKPESRIYLKVGFRANLFENHVEQETFSNPLRITDSNNLVGTYTAGPAEGRLALYPSNQYFEPSAMLVVKRLVWDSTLSATFSTGYIRQNEPLEPFSTNTSDTIVNLAGASFNATDPAALPRPTTQASINTLNTQVRWTAKPADHLHLNLEYRAYQNNVTTPRFVIAEFVREDQDVRTPVGTGATFSSLPIGYTRQTATVSGDYDFGHDSKIGFSYTFEDWDRHYREVDFMNDNRLKISYDTKAKNGFELKSWYEHTIRTTSTYQFNQWHVAQGDGAEITALPMLRKIDEAPYRKDDVQIMATMPIGSAMSLSAHGIFGKTEYNGQTFGLLDNSHQSYGIDYSYDANDRLSFFADYGFEKFHSRLHDRTWTPGDACDPTTQAPGYASLCNWGGVPEDSYNTVGLGVDAYLIPSRFHYTLAYTFSKSHGSQSYTGGGGVDNPFVPTNFNNVDSETFHTVNNELEYKFTKALALVGGYQYEYWNINDYNYNGFSYVTQFNAFNFLPLTGTALYMGGLLPPAYHANIAFARLKFGF
jgi:MtrB/PioB family decaheme-associated outer membrane protein